MKKIAFTGIVIFLVMFLWTCDAGLPDDDAVVEYTDVEYSEDGSFVTVYLDGSKPVPVTKAQRAMTKNLARMAYDYIEVVFYSGTSATGTRARASWELGQSAGISGVNRSVTADANANNYWWDGETGGSDGTAAHPVALMAVGRKDGKTLLGIGRILQVDRLPKMQPGSAVAATHTDPNLRGLPLPVYLKGTTTGATSANVTSADYDARITDETKSVTFWVEAVKTGLLIKDETLSTATKTYSYDSFKKFRFKAPVVASPAIAAASQNRKMLASRSPLGKMDYPLYPLPVPTKGRLEPVSVAYFEFGGAAKTFVKYLKIEDTPVIEKRFPRYLDGGRYMAPQANTDTDSTVTLITSDTDTELIDAGYTAGAYVATDDNINTNPLTGADFQKYSAVPLTTGTGNQVSLGTPYSNIVPLKFKSVANSYGLFSFYIEIPVYLWFKTDSANENVSKPTNGESDAIIWKIRTGLGSELYSLDDGLSAGGCILMGVGVDAIDWLEIEWNWVE